MIKLSKYELRAFIREAVQMLNDDALFTKHSNAVDKNVSTCSICGYQHNSAHGCKDGDNNYMSLSHLAMIQDHANDILLLVNSGKNLDDWMESHISQIADDIIEVKNALQYKNH